MQNIKSQVLHTVSEYNDATKLQFFIELHEWAGKHANIIHNRMNTENIEIVKDETMEIVPTE